MRNFGKHLLSCWLWLLISELLCLILAFSFAILRPEWIRWVSMICGITAHILLMGSCAGKLAHKDIVCYRTERKAIPIIQPVLLGIGTAIPLWLLWGILKYLSDSSAMLNVFLLCNAPYIQLHRVIINGADTFSAVSDLRKILMLLPPVCTAGAVGLGYLFRYLPEKAAIDAKQIRSESLE